MSEFPRISIITPSYNQGRYLEATLRSVLDQGYPNLEYIVIDGGSTDESVAILEKYASQLAYWVSEPDRGQSHAINKGFERATGEILAYLNSDDLYTPNSLGIAAQKLGGKKMGLLVGASIITDGPDALEGTRDSRQPSWGEILYEARTFPQPSVFWTRDLWEASKPLSEDLYFAMDYELWVRMYPHVQETVFTDALLSYARTHPDQKSQEQAIDRFGQQRVTIALREARRRGDSAVMWLIKAWLWQARIALRERRPGLLRGTYFQHDVLRAAFKGGA